ncbi:MAG: SpoIIE family protein phosphatase [Planctomycetales bacterium]|nr:SpoIIE family protein phosphatase [Planctomycetales bacterium]
MARKLPAHLKLHDDGGAQVALSTPSSTKFDLAQTMRAFADATGWVPRPIGGTPHHPLDIPHDADAPLPPLRKRMQLVSDYPMDGMLDADDPSTMSGTSEEVAWSLLAQIDGLVQSLKASERVIQAQEAQLATALGVSIRHDEADALAGRLQESLHRASELTGSDAAALYLLDDTTSALKMRSCWGMPTSALTKPPRDLRGSLADLEALMGNAVLLENTSLAPEWQCPESYAAAMCVPIGSPTMPHGTLWLWSDHVRDFSSADIDAAKAAGDKILVDIERSVLADEVLKTRALNRQVESASLVQSSRLPSSQPLHDDYEIGGWTFQGQALGGNFHTWTVNRQRLICAAMGAAATHGAAGALVATSIQTVVETCWNANHKPSQVLRKANDLMWAAEDGDWRSSLCYLQIHPESGSTQLSLAGNIQAFTVGSHGFRPLVGTSTPLALQPDTRFDNQQLYMEAGELLLIASADVVGGIQRGGFSQEALLKLVRDMHDETIETIVDHIARLLPLLDGQSNIDADRSLLLVRRRF